MFFNPEKMGIKNYVIFNTLYRTKMVAKKATKETAVKKTATSATPKKWLPAEVIAMMNKMNKTYGSGTISLMNEIADVEFQSTGVPSIDLALGGGIPQGRIVEFFWAESSGKTSLALQCIAEAQRQGKLAMLVDVEHAFDPAFAKNLGVDENMLVHVKPDTWEQAFAMMEEALKTWAFGVVVLDSVAALVTTKELDWELEDNKIAPLATLMSKGLKRVVGLISKQGATLILINQVRTNLMQMYGNNQEATGGKAIKFYTSQRVRISQEEATKGITIKNGWVEERIGNKMKIVVEKNKVAPPKRVAKVNFYFQWGFNKTEDMITALKTMRVISQAWAFYSLEINGKLIKAQGMDKLVAQVSEIPYEELEAFFLKKLHEYNKNVANGTIIADDTATAEDLEDFADELDGLEE